MNGPLVSVIVPVFNGERFLKEAIESIFAQDYRPIDVIVVDDGSTDRSAEIAQSFSEVTCVRQANTGLGGARNAGLAVARGAIYAFLDADDILPPTKLSTQVRYLEDHPEVGCVLTQQAALVEPGTKEPEWISRPSRLLGVPGGIPFMSAVIRRESAEIVGPFDTTLQPAEDFDWLVRLRDAGVRIDVLPLVGLIRRIHPDNLTHDGAATRRAFMASIHKGIERHRAEREDA